MSPSTTHVANASEVPIWAKVTDDGTKIIQSVVITIPGKVEARIETASKFAAEHGFTKISPRVATPFFAGDRMLWVFRTKVFASAYYVDPETGAICEICSAHPLPANYSVIVAKDMTIRATEMGELWKDISGQWH
ncbi:unnamed protein product [Haemonchus placei]|uniref:PaREP2b n=1 Tax=Haemonchus placei TaxID=6290 RepID=A0A0N4X4E6_HAEPC|nr:unnamed protein product [Haemonchus placei]